MFYDSNSEFSDADDNNQMHVEDELEESLRSGNDTSELLGSIPKTNHDLSMIGKLNNGNSALPDNVKSLENYNDFAFTQSQPKTQKEVIKEKRKKSKKRKADKDCLDEKPEKVKKSKRDKAEKKQKKLKTGNHNDEELEVGQKVKKHKKEHHKHKKNKTKKKSKEQMVEVVTNGAETKNASINHLTNSFSCDKSIKDSPTSMASFSTVDSYKLLHMYSYVDEMPSVMSPDFHEGIEHHQSTVNMKETESNSCDILEKNVKEKEPEVNHINVKQATLDNFVKEVATSSKPIEAGNENMPSSKMKSNKNGVTENSKSKVKQKVAKQKSLDDVTSKKVATKKDSTSKEEITTERMEMSPESLVDAINRSMEEVDEFFKDRETAPEISTPSVKKKSNSLKTKRLSLIKPNEKILNNSDVPVSHVDKNKAPFQKSKSLSPVKSTPEAAANSGHDKENRVVNDTNAILDDMIHSLLQVDVTITSDSELPSNDDCVSPIKKPKKKTEDEESSSDSEEFSYADLNETVNRADLDILKSLVINLPFEVCELHRIETRVSKGPTPEQVVQIEAMGLTVKRGIYTSEEDTCIKNNWVQFCRFNDITPKPELFLQFIHDVDGKQQTLELEERIKFAQFLARGLNNRLLSSVYKRFRTIFTATKRGRYTSKEDKQILEIVKNTKNAKHVFARIGKMLGRHRISIEKRYAYLRRLAANNYEMKHVSETKDNEIIRQLLQLMGYDDVLQLKNITIPTSVLTSISENLKLRYGKLHNHWYAVLHPRLFVTGSRRMWKVKKHLLELILADSNVKTHRDIRYNEIVLQMDGWTTLALRKLLANLIRKEEVERIGFRKHLINLLDGITGSEPFVLKSMEYFNEPIEHPEIGL